MNGFMSSLINNNKPNFIVEPGFLLETRDTLLFDGSGILGNIKAQANELFFPPEGGAYRRDNPVALFNTHQALYTHTDTYEFFPEISASVFEIESIDFTKQPMKRKNNYNKNVTVGKRITWREAIENPINVYDSAGRLLLKAYEKRDNLIFNPDATMFALQFILDFVEYAILEATSWGNKYNVIKRIESYKRDDVCVDKLLNYGLAISNNMLTPIRNFVRENSWLIYRVSNISSTIMVESSCDYRHFKCNEALWLQQNNVDKDDDLLSTYRVGSSAKGLIDYNDLEAFFDYLIKCGLGTITSLSDLLTLIEENKTNKEYNRLFFIALDNFLKEKENKETQSTKLINKLIGRKNGNQCFNFDQGTGIYFF